MICHGGIFFFQNPFTSNDLSGDDGRYTPFSYAFTTTKYFDAISDSPTYIRIALAFLCFICRVFNHNPS